MSLVVGMLITDYMEESGCESTLKMNATGNATISTLTANVTDLF